MTHENETQFEPLDRSGVNVRGRNGKGKIIFFGVLLIVVIAIAGVATSTSINRVSDLELLPEADTSFEDGALKDKLADNADYFKKLKEKKDLADKKEQKRLAELAAAEAERQRLAALNANKGDAQPSPVDPPAAPYQPRGATANNDAEKGPTQAELDYQRKTTSPVMYSIAKPSGGGQNLDALANSGGDDRFNVPSFSSAKGSRIKPKNLDFLLSRGTSIPCALYTQIISDYEGFVTCVTIQDVYSFNGATLLAERGSVINGSQSVELELGKARLFTTWGDLRTPLGVDIPLNSLGTGPLGASGVPAWVDNHYKEKFGSAVLLSFMDDAFTALANSQKNNDVQFDSSTNNASELASQALESSINITPTGYSKLGQIINIIAVRDIDMTSVYEYR